MTTDAMIANLESYYGRYSRPVMRALVFQRLEAFTDGQRVELFRELIETFSAQYGTQPDVAAIVVAAKGLRPAHKALPEYTVSAAEREKAAEVADGLHQRVVELAEQKRIAGKTLAS